jgi:pyruvate dehydrogenase E2 component (dihydrolipoamide acetyltransferase)
MPDSFILPALGESVTEGTVTRWFKAVGDTVAVDEPLVEVSTDKVDTEIPSPFAGTLLSILVGEDQMAEIGFTLAVIGSTGETPGVEPVETKPVGTSTGESGYVTPMVRKVARRHGVDLSTVTGTGIGGRIRKQDVEAAVSTPAVAEPSTVPAAPAAKAAAAVVPSSLRGTVAKAPRIRSIIATRMRESLDTSTQLTQVHEVDVTAIVRLRERAKGAFAAAHGVKLTYLPFIAQAVAEALKAHPMVNASFDEDAGTITYHDAEDLAFAVDAPKGLLVPVVRDAGSLNLAGLAAGTFSITNIGSVGALFDTPIINQPQVGILGVGAIVKRPMVVTGTDGDDVLAIRHMMYLCLTYDHRLVDGADAGRFLQTVTARLQAAAFEADLGL